MPALPQREAHPRPRRHRRRRRGPAGRSAARRAKPRHRQRQSTCASPASPSQPSCASTVATRRGSDGSTSRRIPAPASPGARRSTLPSYQSTCPGSCHPVVGVVSGVDDTLGSSRSFTRAALAARSPFVPARQPVARCPRTPRLRHAGAAVARGPARRHAATTSSTVAMAANGRTVYRRTSSP